MALSRASVANNLLQHRMQHRTLVKAIPQHEQPSILPSRKKKLCEMMSIERPNMRDPCFAMTEWVCCEEEIKGLFKKRFCDKTGSACQGNDNTALKEIIVKICLEHTHTHTYTAKRTGLVRELQVTAAATGK